MILITGANGFIGSALTEYFLKKKRLFSVVTRHEVIKLNDDVPQFLIEAIGSDTNWSIPLENVDTVIHLAARVHLMEDNAADPLTEFRLTNTIATINLAKQAVDAGVKRFIFLSSIKVNGELSADGQPFLANNTTIPTDPYGLSKYEAEQGLRELAVQTGIEVVIIRPPLVYGPGVKANFLSMMTWLQRGVPLPLGNVKNHRSLVALDNLVDFIVTCIDHPAAANQAFLVSDGDDLSTTDLLKRLGVALGKPARLIPIPQYLLTFSLSLIGKGDISNRLCGSLHVDIRKANELLGWLPPVKVDDAFRKTAKAYLTTISEK